MIKRGIRCFVLGMLMTLSLGIFTSYAEEEEIYFYYDGESILLPENIMTDTDICQSKERGSLISTAISRITNIGGGDIEISLETMAHVNVDEIRQTAYLDRWDEEEQDWFTMETYSDEAFAADHPNGLSSLKSTYIVHNQKTGYYYRVRGMHMVKKTGEGSQTFSTRTNGVLITKNP